MEMFLGFLIGYAVALIIGSLYRGFRDGFKDDPKFIAGLNRSTPRHPDVIMRDIILLTELLQANNKEFDAAMDIIVGEIEKAAPGGSQPKAIPIVYNSEEIACRYMGVDVPKYIKDESGRWFEFESVAVHDDLNRAIVDDIEKEYIKITDDDSKSAFFFKRILEEPVLKEKIEQA